MEESPMRRTPLIIALAASAALAACGQSQQAANVENAYDNRADAIENQADALENQAANASGATEAALDNQADAAENRADQVREAGENKAAAVDRNSH
jgi:hypothetical protein